MSKLLIAAVVLLFLSSGYPEVIGSHPRVSAAVATRAEEYPLPVLAYYYIWFTPTSWDRAKTDLPTLGTYSSDETSIMRKHIRLAKETGIDGFIVSWKHTSDLTSRLRKLATVAEEEDFKLAIIYQGLDFYRDPLTAERLRHDIAFFADEFAANEVFLIWDRPVVIVSGTWKFSNEELAWIAEPVASKLHVLASERNVAGIERLPASFAGNAYYWSSVNPETYPDYPGKLVEMGQSVHRRGGLWLAPAAPGFDARLVGGTTVVERLGGATLRREFAAAVASSPDAVAIISWNEFSENSHIEPSSNFGSSALRTLADILGTQIGEGQLDSSSSGDRGSYAWRLPLLLIGLVGLAAAAAVIVRRSADDKAA